jgi:hypothetical protein
MIINPRLLPSPSLTSLSIVVGKKLETISQAEHQHECLNSSDLSVISGAFYAYIYQTHKPNLQRDNK